MTLPKAATDEIRARAAGLHRPFGSVQVEASIGAVTWRTSLFSDTKRDAYLLPVKADIRRRARITAGDTVDVDVDLIA